MACGGECVDHEGVADHVDELAASAEAVGSSEPEGVFEGPVDRLGVVASAEQFGEAGVVGCDGSDVLGAVELAGGVVVVGVEADGDGAGAEVVGEPVVVVPAVAMPAGVAVGADALRITFVACERGDAASA